MVSLKFYFLTYLANIFYAMARSNSGTNGPSLLASRNRFDADILQAITANQTQQNVVVSPVSIQICLAFALLGAEGETAKQMRLALRIPTTMKKFDIARNYEIFLKRNFQNMRGASKDAPELHMANRIYVDESLRLVTQFNELTKKSFVAEAVPIKFANGIEAAKSINKWVEAETQGKVKDLLQSNEMSARVGAIVVNVIYFKAKWKIPFSQSNTRKSYFRISNQRSVQVDMMYNENEYFKYADLPEMDATALEMPYQHSGVSMLLLLPNKINGLRALEQVLAKLDLRKVVEKMQRRKVDVSLPKFRIEFEVDLKQPLLTLGLRDLFGNSPDFGGLFAEQTSRLKLKVKHKAVLDVNEAGSEAAAASFIKIDFKSIDWGSKQFVADHPFAYMIRSQDVVYFAGHVAHF